MTQPLDPLRSNTTADLDVPDHDLTPDPDDDLDSTELEQPDVLANSPTRINRQQSLGQDYIGQRFDQIAAQVWPDFSREKLKQWLLDGSLQINGQQVKAKMRSVSDELMTLDVALQTQTHAQPQDIALDIVYEDAHLLVINKPAGMVVHPGAGNSDGTLVNALLYHYPQSHELPRAGLVHRIDKDTSGLLVVAKTLPDQLALTQQLAKKTMYRIYDLICYGRVIAGGTIDAPIRRHPVERTKMAVVAGGRSAVTHYRVMERFADFTRIQAQLETGRTHQIRVHFAHIDHPLLGDPAYSRVKLPRGAATELVETLQQFRRQALHAAALGLVHPATGAEMQFEAPWPADFTHLVEQLRQYNLP